MIAYLLSLSFLILTVLLIRSMFRKTVSPRVIYALWLAVFIRMCLPISLFEVDVTFFDFLHTEQNIETEVKEQLTEGNEITVDINEQLPTNPVQDPTASIPIIPPTPVAPVIPSETIQIVPGIDADTPEFSEENNYDIQERLVDRIKHIVNTVWILGMVLVFGWMCLTCIGYIKQLKKDRVLYKIVGGIKVYISEHTVVPCLFGLVPSIYITPEVVKSKSETLIITHEYIHIRHGDHIWSFVRTLALIVFWWNPLVWIAATVSKRDAELACDDAIAAKLDDAGRLSYANILLDTIPQKSQYAVGLGSPPMKERIIMLAKGQKNRWYCLFLTVMLVISAAGCSLVSLSENDDIIFDENSVISTEENDSYIPNTSGITEITIPHSSIFEEMQHIEENELFPADEYIINVTGMSVPIKLYMYLDCVTAIGVYGQHVEMRSSFDIYGNCSFELFEFGGAVVIGGGFHRIGDIYIISSEKYSEIHPGTEASYWLYLDDSGSLKYTYLHNEIADIVQSGALSTAVAYDEFLYESGNASIENGEVIFFEPDESYTMSDRYDLNKEFMDWYSDEYSSIDEVFSANFAKRNVKQYGQGPFVGYVADKETPWIDLYTEKNGSYVSRIPYGIFHDWVATDRNHETWKPGWDQEYLCYYYAEYGDFRWAAVHLKNTVLGVGRKNIATSSDGGKTWNYGSTGDNYGGNHVVGIGFISENIAFMSFDPTREPDGATGPLISRTVDGGKTWELLHIWVPKSLSDKKLISGIPFYDGELLRYPVWQIGADTMAEGDPIYLISRDNGLTWEWENIFEDDAESLFINTTLPHLSIMENRLPFYVAYSGEKILLFDWLKNNEMSVSRYAVINLDRDVLSETVLWLTRGTNEYIGFLILHSDTEKTYAHLLYYREFSNLKSDGSFSFSGGVSNCGFGRICFSGSTYKINRIAYCISDDNRTISYYSDETGKAINKSEFDNLEKIQNNKSEVVWYEWCYLN